MDAHTESRTGAADRSIRIPADEVAGTIAARQALGPDSEPAVIAAFLERTGYAVDARVDARVAAHLAGRSGRDAPGSTRDPGSILLGLGSMAIAIPLTGIATQFNGVVALLMVVIAWAGIVAVNIAFNHR